MFKSFRQPWWNGCWQRYYSACAGANRWSPAITREDILILKRPGPRGSRSGQIPYGETFLSRRGEISAHVKGDGSIYANKHTSTSITALRTSIYITLVGIVGLVFPGCVIQCMTCLSKDPLQSLIPRMYIQLGGTLACLFGLYYAGAAFDDIQGRYPVGFYTSTVIGRYFLAMIFGLMYFMHGRLHTWVLLLGIMNALSAGMMQRAISTRN